MCFTLVQPSSIEMVQSMHAERLGLLWRGVASTGHVACDALKGTSSCELASGRVSGGQYDCCQPGCGSRL